MFGKILMATDGSHFALHAAEYGADIAKRYDAEVTLLYVAEMPPIIGIPPSDERIEQTRQELSAHGKEALLRTHRIFEDAGVQPIDELEFGSAVPAILERARGGDYELLVIGSRGAGTGAIEQILIGSVAEGILHGAPCPVLMVRFNSSPRKR